MNMSSSHFVLGFKGVKTKNRLWHPADSDSAPSNYVESTGCQKLTRNAEHIHIFWNSD